MGPTRANGLRTEAVVLLPAGSALTWGLYGCLGRPW